MSPLIFYCTPTIIVSEAFLHKRSYPKNNTHCCEDAVTGECIRSGGERREDDPISGNSVPQEPLCLMHVLARSEEGALTDRNVILRKKRLIF